VELLVSRALAILAESKNLYFLSLFHNRAQAFSAYPGSNR
jgi:hypothetical protein